MLTICADFLIALVLQFYFPIIHCNPQNVGAIQVFAEGLIFAAPNKVVRMLFAEVASPLEEEGAASKDRYGNRIRSYEASAICRD
ncbi:hypothetical protein CEXT_686971 [Caerostris extrusa]|uniref:Uncharacterized protein n=1 Tax=Caerostris extrusa TaxID=172846 RepID=A0AAV4X0S8_CAEEX|nr:hypothetical protein CEXT_686971 [Caerostris extrusa]